MRQRRAERSSAAAEPVLEPRDGKRGQFGGPEQVTLGPTDVAADADAGGECLSGDDRERILVEPEVLTLSNLWARLTRSVSASFRY